MKKLSLQWRITLMTVLLIGITCVAMNLLLCSSGVYYMDTIADSLQGGGTVILNDGGAASFDPQLIAPNEEVDHRRGCRRFQHHQLVHHGGGNAAQRHPRLFRQRTRSQAPAQLYLAGGAGAAEQFGGYEDKRRCAAGIQVVKPILQQDA